MSNPLGPLLLVTPWYPPTIGGVSFVVQRLYRLFNGAGVPTSVWVADDPANRSSQVSGADGDVVYRYIPATAIYRLSPWTLLSTLVGAPKALWNAWRHVSTRGIRTVVLVYPVGSAWPFVVLRWLGVIRLVSSCHGNEILTLSRSSPGARWLSRRVLAASDAITVPAAHLVPAAEDLAGGPKLPIWLIPNCIDDTYFRPAEVKGGRKAPTLIHVSAFTPRKRTLDIVRAFAMANLSKDSRLLMVGDGPEREAAQQLASELGVLERVVFTGAPDDVRPYFWQSDLLVMASDEESGPLTLLEAMACEIPWVMTPWGIAMTLPAGEFGTVVPARDPEALAHAMESMLADTEKLRAMGIRGRRKVTEEFGEAKYLERHLQLVRAVEGGTGEQPVDFSNGARTSPR